MRLRWLVSLVATAELTTTWLAPRALAQALPSVHDYRIRVFGVADGLPQSNVNGVVQMDDHRLWIATARGLLRYDGQVFEPVPTPGLDHIDWMRLDHRGRIWIRSHRNQLGLIDGESFRILPELPGYESRATLSVGPDRIRGMTETADGSVWFGGEHGLVRTDADAPGAFTLYTTADGLPSDVALGVYDVPGGDRVVVTHMGLARIDGTGLDGRHRFRPFGPPCRNGGDIVVTTAGLHLNCLEEGRRYHVLEYAGGEIRRRDFPVGHWASGSRLDEPPDPDPSLDSEPPRHVLDDRPHHGGWYLQVGLTWESVGLPPDTGPIRGRILWSRDGTLWRTLIGDAPAPQYLARQRGRQIEHIPLRDHLEFSRISEIFEDHEGSLWIGTDRGLLQLVHLDAAAFTIEDGLAEGFTTGVLQTSDGAVWVATWGGGLHRFADGRSERRYTPEDGLPSLRVRALYEARDGTLWIGTHGGAAALRDGRISRTHPLDETRAFAETPDGAFWMGTADGLFRLAPDVARRPASLERVLDGSFWSLRTTRDGALWMGSEDGLFRYADGRTRRYGVDDGLPSPNVPHIYEEADGTLWFGTFAGLVRYRDGRFTTLTSANGLHSDGVWCMVEDGRGGVWMTSDQGTARVAHAELHAAAEAHEQGAVAERLQPLLITEAQGLPSRESNRASPGCGRLDDGRLIVNNIHGFAVIDPARVDVPPPRTTIRRVAADGVLLPEDSSQEAELAPGTRHVQFDFTAISFVAPERNRYRYRLAGLHDDWIEAGPVSRASYTNLPLGSYAFEVQSITGGSGWGEPTAWAFEVPPFLWQASWFRALMAVTLMAGLAALYRYRVSKLLEMERLRLRIASDLHDDIGANLSSIAMLSEMLRDRAHLGGRELKQLRRIGAAAEETMVGLRDVIWLVDPKHDSLAELVHKMRAVAADLLAGTEWSFHAPHPLPARTLDMAVVRNAFLSYKEALTNAVRHGRPGRVEIEVSVEGNELAVTVADDGSGFDVDEVASAGERASGGHGLANMRRRANEAGGHFDVESAPGAGARVRFSVRMS